METGLITLSYHFALENKKNMVIFKENIEGSFGLVDFISRSKGTAYLYTCVQVAEDIDNQIRLFISNN